jgi:hypothetical protein
VVVTLTYADSSSNDHSMAFGIYGIHWADVEYERFLHEASDHSFTEKPVGYRYGVRIDFFPLHDNLEKRFFLYAYLLGTNRRATFESTTRLLAFRGDALEFTFVDNLSFGDAFSMYLVERSLRYVTDNGSTRTLKPLYHGWDDSDVGSYVVNLVDSASVKLKKKDLDFTGGARDDPTWAYNHVWTVDFGTVLDSTKQQWLIELPLWKNKKIDLSDIYPDQYYDPIEIVSTDMELRWRFEDGVQPALAAKMTFLEKSPRTTAEQLTPIPWQLVYLAPPARR